MTETPDPIDDWVADALREVQHEAPTALDPAEAAKILGAQPDEPDRPITADEATRMLGGTPREQLAAVTQHRRNPRRALERAMDELNVERPPAHIQTPARLRMYFAGEWRYHLISRCHRVEDQMRIVGYLEENLDGTETEIPTEISDAVSRIVDRSRTQPREYIPPTSSAMQYLRLAKAYRQHVARQSSEEDR